MIDPARAPSVATFARRAARWALSAAYAVAGVFHLKSPAGFIAITPAWVPDPALVIELTGIAELAGAAGLFIPRSRRAAAAGLALYALCVWPANFHHALADIPIGGKHLSWWYHGPRLALQPVIVWWALWAGEVVDWPFRARKPAAA